MKASIYFNYTTRSLWRGGQRTILALFCIAVGVMSIVALQLVGQMVNNSFTSNVREANGGDIAATTYTQGLEQSDLAFFNNLKANGTITAYTALESLTSSFSSGSSNTSSFSLQVVDPATFPVVTAPTFVQPADGHISDLLTNGQVLIDQDLADRYQKKVGDELTIWTSSGLSVKKSFHVTLSGILADNGAFSSTHSVMLLSTSDYQRLVPDSELSYDHIYMTTADQAHTDKAVQAVKDQFPLLNTQTAADQLKQEQASVDLIKKFLSIAGLLALLIGGVGIVNTMQVLLSRRKTEIAMLKTTGYRRIDLYLLFGLEAGLLGLIGGIIGTLVAIGVSYLVLMLLMHLLAISIPFALDPVILGSGVLIGLSTALIFGLMPIVQAANIRPLNVIRDLPGENQVGSILLSIGLILLLSVLFCVMSIIILNSVVWGISAVYGTFIFLALLSLVFSLVVLLIGHLPVPERLSFGYIALVGIPLLLAILLALVLPAFGGVLAFIAVIGLLVVFVPRTWKVSIKMALRNIGRQRARTTTTLLALFVGVFTIGLILALAQNIRAQLDNTLAQVLTFNVAALTEGSETDAINNQQTKITGLQHIQQDWLVSVEPIALNGQSLAALAKQENNKKTSNSMFSGPAVFAATLSNLEGFDVSHNQFPIVQETIQGRNLNASDAGTDNVILSSFIAANAPANEHIGIGSTITVMSKDGKTVRTLHIVGLYAASTTTIGSVLVPKNTITELSPRGAAQSIFYMKIDPNKVASALGVLDKLAPNAYILNLADIGSYLDQLLSNILWMLTALALFSLLAGVIIIANAVALAMLERRRELGILKSVGYTSRTLLSEVLVENGIVGGTGAILAMLLVTFVTSLLGQFTFHTNFGVSWYIAIGLIIGIALLAVITALLVAWQSVRVRPLEVLRYE